MLVAPWVIAIALAALGCSVIVGGDPPSTFACEPSLMRDPCQALDPPMRCVATETGGLGTCQPCGVEICGNAIDDDCNGIVDDVDEVCNNEDDDCDGAIDEDLDVDDDGFTWCRTGPTPLDCDDNDDDVFPRDDSGSERCDAIDNDCNPDTADGSGECDAVDEACNPLAGGCVPVFCDTRGDLCNADEFCDQTTSPPACAPLDDSCFRTGCDGGDRCDPRTGACVTPMADGSLCDGDAECVSSLCVLAAAIRGTAVLGGRAGVCGRTCCSDSDCGDQSVCWASGSGARACIPTSILEMGEFGAPEKEVCASRSECDQDCSLDAEDAFTVENRLALTCSPPFVARRSCSTPFDCRLGEDCLDGTCEQSCTDFSDCPTGLCSAGSFTGRCTETCGSASDCPTGVLLNEVGCRFGSFRLGSLSRDDYVAFCSYNNSGNAPGGASCTADNDCADFACLTNDGGASGASRTCAATCCNDDDCGGEQCRPIFLRGHWETHCRPRPTFPGGGG